MTRPVRILLQTTIPSVEDDWNINRFSLLTEYLGSLANDRGENLCEVTTRDRKVNSDGNDTVLTSLDETDFDELWLFAVDPGDGLTQSDCRGITRFRQRGGGILTTRDHQDLGSSLCTLGGIGRAHYFHSRHRDPDDRRHTRDDQYTSNITWPNYHSGSNGDYQNITPFGPTHEVLLNPHSPSGVIEVFPAHPHEGAVGAPLDEDSARVIATGVSKVTQRPFNLLVVFENSFDAHGNKLGRAIAQSSFHHLVDYNWDTTQGCPSFLLEPPGDQIEREPEKLSDIKAYVQNVAMWLRPDSR